MPYRDRFPYFDQTDTIYLDNAMTTQKPASVIEAVQNTMTTAANVHRGQYTQAKERTDAFEQAREQIAALIGATTDSIVFTSGATQSLNHVCTGWATQHLTDGDNILYCPDDHASAVEPIEQLQKEMAENGTEIELRPIERNTDGSLDHTAIEQQIDTNTALIRLTHIHNVYGSVLDIETITEHIPDHVAVCLDASQSVGHCSIDVSTAGIDFLSFSGHKMFGPSGIGVLWVDEHRQEEIQPLGYGGGQQEEPFPRYMEPGTPAISSIIGLGEAARFIHEIGTEQIRSHLTTLTSQLIAGLDDRITLLGPEHPTAGPVSIRIDDVPAADAGYVFDKEGIAVRTGQHCRSTDEIENSIRISPHIYNTKAEIETTLSVIRDLAP